MFGTVTRVVEARGFFFIRPDDGTPDVFGHCKDLQGMPFDSTLQERRVEFGTQDTEKGRRAVSIHEAR